MADTGNMVVSVSFPGLEKKSAPIRSLINFMMENSSLYFRKRVECDNEDVFSVAEALYDNRIHLSGNWDDIERDIFLYGNLYYNDQEIVIRQFIEDCDGNVTVTLPDSIEVESYQIRGWYDLIAAKCTTCLVTCNSTEVTLTMVEEPDNPEVDPVPITGISGTFHVYGILTNALEEVCIIDDEYVFENGVCTFSVDDEYTSGGAKAFKTNAKVRLTGTIKNKYTQRIYEYSGYSDSVHYPPSLYIKYDDEKFEQIKRPIEAKSTDDDSKYYCRITAVKPGVEGNNYKVVIDSSTSGDDYILASIYNGSELLYSQDVDCWRSSRYWDDDSEQAEYVRVSYVSDFEYLELHDGLTLGDIFIFEGTYSQYNNSQVYFRESMLPIEIQLSGGADDGGDYDVTSDALFADCNTVLCKANTKLSFGFIPQALHYSNKINTVDIDDIDVTITPMINGKENKDDTVVPNIKFNSENYANINLSSGRKLDYDIQLRTTSFTIASSDFNRESEEFDPPTFSNVFYKVGVCPVNNSLKTDELAELLSHCGLRISNDYYSYYPNILIVPGAHYPSFASALSVYSDLYNYFINLDKYTGDVEIDSEYPDLNYRYESVPRSAVLPIMLHGGRYIEAGYLEKNKIDINSYDDTPTVVGFAYLKLCNTDGTPYTGKADSEVICLSPIENVNEYIENFNDYQIKDRLTLSFKDRMIDGGYSIMPQFDGYNGGKENYNYDY